MLLQPSSSSLSQKESSTLADLNLCGKVNVSKYLTCVIRCVFSEVILESKLCTYVIRCPPQWMEPEYNTILRFLIFCVNLCKCLIFVKKGPCEEEEEEQQDQGEFPDFISSQAPLQPSSSTLPETDFSDNTTTTTVPDSNVIPSTEDNFSDNVPSQESSAPKESGVSVPSTQASTQEKSDNVPLLQESSAPEESGVSVPSTQASTQEKSDNVTDNVPLLQESTPPPKESGVSVPSTVSSEVLDFSVHSQVVAPLQPQAPLQPSAKENVKDPLICGSAGNISFELLQHEGN